jgi:beta-1,4-mannosyl-glycoprotein beta-1,4-N-acetylglucosaminyltransferase
MIYDIFTYNGEMKTLQLHLGVLNDYVDRFIIVEANKTFTGKNKPLYLPRHEQYIREYWKKIDYYIVNEWDDVKLWEMAIQSPNTQGAEHWKREFYIKESIQKALKRFNVQDDDTLFIGDVDEIIDPHAEYESDSPIKAKLRVYAYWLNNLSDEEFWGTLICQYGDIKNECLNHLRSDTRLYSKGDYLGWHFTSMGGTEEVRRKLDDSYTTESYNTQSVQQLLADRIKSNVDYLGRDFAFSNNTEKWPQFLKNNTAKFTSMLK